MDPKDNPQHLAGPSEAIPRRVANIFCALTLFHKEDRVVRIQRQLGPPRFEATTLPNRLQRVPYSVGGTAEGRGVPGSIDLAVTASVGRDMGRC